MSSEIKDKNSQTIEAGDDVFTPIRGGAHKGTVENIITDDKDAEQHNVKNPPKVIYTDQHGHKVAHNPETLRHEK
ncbi:unnamed protein product [Clonostachys chloroleuca]|uniref:Hypervirulence associated protein TUDOR domain-containing protein n=1 Tax=Clonostachys chloroleuca TaxID=1926264 RepID=A0AA35QGJ1_9HYPO|nr:unnamed protein product [Clonostachys chloroleuca]